MRLVNSVFSVPKFAKVEKRMDAEGKKILNIFNDSKSDQWQIIFVSFEVAKYKLGSNEALVHSIWEDLELGAKQSNYELVKSSESRDLEGNIVVVYQKILKNSKQVVHGKIIADSNPICLEYLDEPGKFSVVLPLQIINSRRFAAK